MDRRAAQALARAGAQLLIELTLEGDRLFPMEAGEVAIGGALLEPGERLGDAIDGYIVPPPGLAQNCGEGLLLDPLRWRRQPQIEIFRFQRVFVVAQSRIVRGNGNGKSCRQRLFDQSRALELVEAR